MHEDNGKRVSISPYADVTVTVMNHIVEVQHLEKENHGATIKKLDKEKYLDLSTGEIKFFDHIENRQQNLNGLRKTFKKLRYLINNNFTGKGNELHAVLTYRRHVTDPKELYRDFDKFMKRLRYAYKDKTTIDYLSVIEPQGSGRWHSHCLLRFNDLDSIYIPNKFDREHNPIDAPLYDLWGQGWVTIKSLKDIDNIGAYLSAYLTDIELDVNKFENGELNIKDIKDFLGKEFEIATKQIDGREKKFIKGGRLHMYPPGMNLYRKSKGIVEPVRQKMKFKDVKKVVGSVKPNYQKKITVESDDFTNTIQYLQYNMKRNQK